MASMTIAGIVLDDVPGVRETDDGRQAVVQGLEDDGALQGPPPVNGLLADSGPSGDPLDRGLRIPRRRRPPRRPRPAPHHPDARPQTGGSPFACRTRSISSPNDWPRSQGSALLAVNVVVAHQVAECAVSGSAAGLPLLADGTQGRVFELLRGVDFAGSRALVRHRLLEGAGARGRQCPAERGADLGLREPIDDDHPARKVRARSRYRRPLWSRWDRSPLAPRCCGRAPAWRRCCLVRIQLSAASRSARSTLTLGRRLVLAERLGGPRC